MRAIAILVAWLSLTVAASAQPFTDQQIVELIIQDSRNAYYATGHPCACPYDHARNGSMCGGRSAYSRPGGAEPLCFPKDVTGAMVMAYRASHPH
jgi:hypothetical protein